MERTYEREEGLNWPFLGVAVATSALGGGVALGVGYLAAESGWSFDGTVFLVGLLGVALLGVYATVLSSVDTLTPGMGVGHLGGTPNPGRIDDAKGSLDDAGVSPSHLVLFVGVGFLAAGALGVVL